HRDRADGRRALRPDRALGRRQNRHLARVARSIRSPGRRRAGAQEALLSRKGSSERRGAPLTARTDAAAGRRAASAGADGRVAGRAETERARNDALDALYELVDRDSEVGGGIIAGALAYRLFIWLLPFALVLVAGLGIASDAASRSPDQAAKSLGLAGLVST